MLAPTKWVMEDLCTLLLEMGLDTPTKAKIVFNLEHPMDVEIFLGLWCVFLLLEVMHNFIKLNYMWDIFVCDFITIVKYARGCLYYVFKHNHNFQVPYFPQFLGGGQIWRRHDKVDQGFNYNDWSLGFWLFKETYMG